MQELLKALVKAKEEFEPIRKDKTGPRSKYSSLDSVLAAVEPSLHKNGLCVVQATKQDGERFYLETTLFHTSGDYLTSTYPLLNGADPQKVGSSITYARRYSLCALLSVVADEDDDGAAASPSSGLSTVPRGKPAAKPQSRLEGQVEELIAHGKANGLTVDQIKSVCRKHNLPDTKTGYTNPDQVTTLAQLIEDEIAKNNATEEAA